ncbi:M20/M25/M40 family metallo-hydrolase [Nocardioides sp. MAH-18]|uniref:M20/M25/M40 family metallo-hydrolase n=1 Tax=Nocardioides agri TaxID=2682843 RepID=A0A6L6Y0J6_9ACTN|nr:MULTISPECIES: dipeptidase [unclassified Nocardioides]MBA2956252.1 dipeptidase [Nocardioides sp. CGMCC 1.13656]MVQ51095.1 M20/M25/M40 family metallo-hydrolase [Nocardioides sp. MAH-18]
MTDLEQLRERVAALMPRVRTELTELVAIPSVADPRQFPPEECARAAQWVVDAFAEVGFGDLAQHETADGSMAVVGSRPGPDPDAPTVLLYAHYDVQPPLDDDAWRTPPFELTEVDGRWFGRGAADCKGNLLMLLTALRALGDDVPVNLRLVVEGSEEQGTGGLEDFVPRHPDLLRADAILVCDTGNAAVGQPALTVSLRGMVNVVVHVEALPGELHSGMFGGPTPDALAALVAILASLRDADGNTTVRGLDHSQTWSGAPYDPETFRADASIAEGEALLGSGTVSDMLWARPALTILGIDCPPVVGSSAAIVPRASARMNLRIPPGTTPEEAQAALTSHLTGAAPWGVSVSVEIEATGSPFSADTGGPAYTSMLAAMADAYGRDPVLLGQGGSIPLCNVFAGTYPGAEIMLLGVEEPLALIHAPNESVDPGEIERLATAAALFLQRYAGR